MSRSIRIGEFLKESRIAGSTGNTARKITVKLYGKGVFAKQENRPGSENTSYYKRKAGQFIYSKLDFLNGAFGIVPEELDGHESTVDLPCFDFTSPEISPEWFLQFVSRSDFYSYQGGLGNGGRKARRISPDDFLNLEIEVPPLPEQKKIAEILSGIDKQLDLIRSQESKTHELLRAILQSAFSEPDLSPYSDTSNSLAELETLGKISLGRGDIISKIDIRERPGGHPIYSSSGKGDGKFGEYGEYMFDEELITWSIDGGGRLFHRSKHKFSVTNVCGYLRKMDDSIDYGYLHSALEYQHAKIKFDYSHKAHPSVIREIYRVALPPLERQIQIASTTASAKQQIEALANKRNTLTTLKSAVSSDLLSGRKRVTI